MPYFNYHCNSCGKKYKEFRPADFPQHFIKCDVCNGDFVEDSE